MKAEQQFQGYNAYLDEEEKQIILEPVYKTVLIKENKLKKLFVSLRVYIIGFSFCIIHYSIPKELRPIYIGVVFGTLGFFIDHYLKSKNEKRRT